MTKHQIFLVHGMGDFETGWAGGIQTQLRKAMQSNAYPTLRASSWADHFEFQPITYNQVFEQWRKQWREDSERAAQGLTDAHVDNAVARRLVDLAKAGSPDDFWRTHVLDVVLYRSLREVASEVGRSVESQIRSHLDSFGKYPPHYTIIAHSLGSAVVYETLHAMLTAPGSLAPVYRPDNVIMVANTARALWNRGGDCYPPEMAPSYADHIGLCYRFANFAHELDPFAQFQPFNPPPPNWLSPSAPPGAYQSIEIPANDIAEFNVHAFQHYLSHPLVHVPIFRMLTGFDDVVTQAEEQAAVQAWRAQASNSLSGHALDLLQTLASQNTGRFQDEIELLLNFRREVLRKPLLDGESGGQDA